MKPDFVIMINSPTEEIRHDIIQWCLTNVGPPYNIIERPAEGVPVGADYDDVNGTWIAYINNAYVYGYSRPVDTWCFRDSDDALAFKLKWGILT